MKGNGSLSRREIALLYASNLMGCKKGTTIVVQSLRKLPRVFSGQSAEEVAERMRAIRFSCSRSATNRHRMYDISFTFVEKPEMVIRERQEVLRAVGSFSIWRRAWSPAIRAAGRPRQISLLPCGESPNEAYGILESRPITGSLRGPLQKQSIWRVSKAGTLERIRPPRGKKTYSAIRCTHHKAEWDNLAKKSAGFPETELFEEPQWNLKD